MQSVIEVAGSVSPGGAQVSTGRALFAGPSGRWASEQLMRQMTETNTLSTAALRTAALLRNEEWIFVDTEVVRAAGIRLRGIADLIAAGLVRTIPNGLAKTVLEYNKAGDMDPAIVSMDGITRAENDRVEYLFASLPLPIIHKDWYLNLRVLLASRLGGEPMDTTYASVAATKVSEEAERMLFQGGKQFAGITVYGYTTHPHRATQGYSVAAWSGAATGASMLADIQIAINTLQTRGFYGPYGIYASANSGMKLGDDFKAESDRTVRDRILDLENVSFLRVVDSLPASTVVVVQLTPDVVQLVEGEPVQTVQWDSHGGFMIQMKVFAIWIPLIKSNSNNQTGVVHIA